MSNLRFGTHRIWLAIMLAVPLGSAGCDRSRPPTYPARGKIQFATGERVGWGLIEVESTEHQLVSRGTIRPDGSFELSTFSEGDGAPAGQHRVAISQLVIADQLAVNAHQHSQTVAPRYASFDTSELEVEIAERDNDLLLVVEPAPASTPHRR